MNDKYPMQPIMNGRFESNPIVDWLCTEVSSMNDIAHYCAEDDIAYKYQEQLAQLVGYSVGGYGSLSYVSDESYERAENQMNIDNLATQTPEEKEALDSIKSVHLRDYQKVNTTPHQCEMSKFKSNPVIQLSIDEIDKFSGEIEWNGEGLPPVGSLCKVNRDSFVYRVMYSSEYVVIVQNLDNDNTTAHGMDIILDLHKGNYTFSKPESPQQREERERLEAAYDLYVYFSGKVGICTFEEFVIKLHLVSKWLRIVDKTNYRKESD